MSKRKTSDHRAESTYSTQYDIAAIRGLIRDAFMTGELVRFCQDRPIFRPVLRFLSSNFGLEGMADILIEYCQTRLLFPELLSEIREFNPRQYERHQVGLGNICGSAKTELEYQSQPQGVLRESHDEPRHDDILIDYEKYDPSEPGSNASYSLILFDNGDRSNRTDVVDGCTVVDLSTDIAGQMNHWWSDPVFT